MRSLLHKIKPTSGIAHFLHLGLVMILPVVVFMLVQLHFVQLALSIIVLSKWRMFAVRPRFWAANVRANAVDLMVGLSIVVFMTHSSGVVLQLVWMVLYGVWLLAIKPGASVPMITSQAFLGQLAALMALYLTWADGPIYGLTLLTGLFCIFPKRFRMQTKSFEPSAVCMRRRTRLSACQNLPGRTYCASTLWTKPRRG